MSAIKDRLLDKCRVLYRERPWMGSLLLFAVIIAFHGWSLMRFPQLFVDEAWAANRAWGFLQTGRAFGTLDSDFMTEFPGYWTYFPLLHVLAQAAVLQFSPAPSLLAVRLLSLFWGLVLLGCSYWIARRLLGARYAMVSVLLVAFSWPFCISAHWARADIMAAALGYGAIALYLAPKTPRFWPSLIAGLLVGLAFEVHPNAAIFGPALVALSWAGHGWSVWKQRDFWGLVAGGMLGLGFYAALHILPYPGTYFAFNEIFFSATHTPPLLTGDLKIIWRSFIENLRVLMDVYQFPLVLLATLGWAMLFRNVQNVGQRLLVLSGTLFTGFILLVRNKFPYYVILFTPVLDLLVAWVLVAEFSRLWEKRAWNYLRRALILGLILGALIRVFVSLQVDYYADYLETQAQINAFIESGERIMGPQTYWFGLYEHDYDSWEELVYYQRYQPDSTLEEAFGFYRPDILIVDGHLKNFIRDDVGETLYSEYLRLPQSELKAFLEAHAQLVSEFDSGIYGWVQIYRLLWP